MNRHILLATTAMTPSERRIGRFLRAPEGHDDGAGNDDSGDGNDSTTNSDNKESNSGESNADGSPKDNAGQAIPGKGFWEGKAEEPAGNDDSTAEGQAIGAELAGMIKTAGFAPVFTKEVQEKLAEGDFESVNNAIAASHREAMTQSVGVFARLVTAFGTRMEKHVEERIQTALGNMQNEQTLEQMFPAAKDPAARPLIEKVFNQALVNTKGNRVEATKQTKEMLKAFGDSTGLTTPPNDPSGSVVSGSSKSLVDELLGRDS